MSRKKGGVEMAGVGLVMAALGACAHDPLTDPPPRALSYAQAIDCAGLLSALHRLGEPEGWTYDRRADMFVYWAEELAPAKAYEAVAPAVRAGTMTYLQRFPNLNLLEDPTVLEPLQEQLRSANAERLYECERQSPAFNIVIVAAQ